jgi:hypothetical protein
VLPGSLEVVSRLDEPMRSFEGYLRDDPAYAHVYFRPRQFPNKIQTWCEEIGELLGIALRHALMWAKGNLHRREIEAFLWNAASVRDVASARGLWLGEIGTP